MCYIEDDRVDHRKNHIWKGWFFLELGNAIRTHGVIQTNNIIVSGTFSELSNEVSNDQSDHILTKMCALSD